MEDEREPEAEPAESVFWVSSMFGAKTRQPLVSITFRDVSVDITPADARAVAYNLLDAAAAADYDGIVWDVMHDVGMDDIETAKMMHLFRTNRDKKNP